jgi:hypothetical protein
MAESKEAKPLIKLMSKMLTPKKSRPMKMSLKPSKNKHQVKFY